MFFFYMLKVYFIAKVDNSNRRVFGGKNCFRVKKNTSLIFVISSDDNVDAWQALLWS